MFSNTTVTTNKFTQNIDGHIFYIQVISYMGQNLGQMTKFHVVEFALWLIIIFPNFNYVVHFL